jgi:hypothetical protein
MGRTLTLKLPEEVYQPLAQTAERTGTTPAQLAVEWLAAASRQATGDPLEPFIGALRTGVPDWPDQHDQYLGQALREPTSEGTKPGA